MHNVALALVRRDGRWLVAKRRPDVHLGGSWEFPGGKYGDDEAPERAAVRELLEECAVVATPLRALDAFTCDYEDRTVRLTPVLCAWQSGEPQPIECECCGWVTIAELMRLDMPAVNADIIRAALELDATA